MEPTNDLKARITERSWDYTARLREGCHMGFDSNCPYPACTCCPIGKMYRKLQALENMIEDKQVSGSVPCAQVKNLFNSICTSFQPLSNMTDGRRKHIAARFAEGHTLQDFETVFKNAEASDFLSGRVAGKGDRYFHPPFDWFVKNGDNFVKVLEGNYNNQASVPDKEHSYDLDKFERMAMSYTPKI